MCHTWKTWDSSKGSRDSYLSLLCLQHCKNQRDIIIQDAHVGFLYKRQAGVGISNNSKRFGKSSVVTSWNLESDK